jgi:hypothetical protein
VSAAPENSLQATAASAPVSHQAGVTAGGTAAVVAAVPQPERESDEAEQQLERTGELQHHLDLDKPQAGGNASAAPPSGRIHWLP